MEGTSLLEKKPFSKRTSILVSAVTGLLVFAVLIVLITTNAKQLPEVLNQQFNEQNAAATFDNLGNGTWAVENGVYTLAKPAILTNQSAGNSNVSINKQNISASNWRLYTQAKANAGDPSDFSIIFDYVDEGNYYFANFSTSSNGNNNGIFKVAGGVQANLATFPSNITADKTYEIEIRKDGTKVKIYLDGKYLATTKDGESYASSKVGYGSRGGAATFDNLTVGAEGAITDPSPTPTPEDPQPTPTPGPTPTPAPTPAPTTPAPTPTPTPNGGRAINVSNSDQLVAAITGAKPGDVINLADGTYDGKMLSPLTVNGGKVYGGFVGTASGTAELPIVVQGSRKAIVSGDGIGGHYGIHLYKVNYWVIKGISVGSAKKGIMLDGSNHNVIDGVEVYDIHDEGIHLRSHSSDNIVKNSSIHHTGLTNKGLTNGYGEGLYVGSANSNWGVYTGGQQDKSDRNQLVGNVISYTAGEGIDIKEGTVDGLIKGNTFNNAGISGSNFADSWVDIKGNNWTITENVGTSAKLDGFQIHGVLKGWGNNNTFTKNNLDVKANGYGFWVQNNVTGNQISCQNTVTNAKAGFGNTSCKD